MFTQGITLRTNKEQLVLFITKNRELGREQMRLITPNIELSIWQVDILGK